MYRNAPICASRRFMYHQPNVYDIEYAHPSDLCTRCPVCQQVFMYHKASTDDNEYAHPMDLCPVVDLCAGRVIHIDAYPQPPAIPLRGANYHRCGWCAMFGMQHAGVHHTCVVCGVWYMQHIRMWCVVSGMQQSGVC
eukprot:GHRQ01028954.1.p2 GENE.GHRQ01028954.1~~GHRQ01028954.1.p2  ORF type:complete len:137 (-),score=22.84 GHRQ01028954.1:779-1189(-)